MATGNAKRFVELGVAPRLARELASQITAGVGNFRRLGELGMMPGEAKRVAAAINGTIISNNRMTETSLIPRVLRELNAQLGSTGGTPGNSVAPALSTTSPQVGSAITTTTGTWSNSPTSYAYQWFYADTSAAISGATSSSYTPVSGDIGHTLCCRVTASNASGAGSPAFSNTSSAVTASSTTALPSTSTIVMRLRASDLSASTTDGSKVASWTDPISGTAFANATSAQQPTFKAAGFGSNPTVRFAGPTTPQSLNGGSPTSIINALSSSGYTVVAIVANTGSSTYGCIFNANTGSSGPVWASHNGTRAGIGAGVPANSYPWTSAGLTITGLSQSANPTTILPGVYLQGTRVRGAGSPGAGSIGTNPLMVGNTSNNATATAFNGDVLEIIVWSDTRNPAEWLQIAKYAHQAYGVALPYAAGGKFWIASGDSQTEGQGLTQPEFTYPNMVAAAIGLPLGAYTNVGLASATIAQINSRAPTHEDPIPALVGVKTALTQLEWYNQAGASPTPSQATFGYADARKTANPSIKLGLMDSLDSGTPNNGAASLAAWEAWRASYNTDIANGFASHADAKIVLSTDPNVGVSGSAAAANAYWQADLIHPTCNAATGTGHAAMAAIIGPAVTALVA